MKGDELRKAVAERYGGRRIRLSIGMVWLLAIVIPWGIILTIFWIVGIL